MKNPAGATLLTTGYRYTLADGTDTGQVQQRTDDATITAYTYDGLGRLTHAGTRAYAYDLAGNLTSGDGHTYTVNAADQLTRADSSTLGYDGAGNLTTSPDGQSHYSPTNQLTSITSSAGTVFNAGYDTLDQTQPATITEHTGNTDVSHVFTHTALGISQVVDNGNATSYAHDTAGNLAAVTGTAGKHAGAVTDYQGSVLALIDNTGTVTARYAYSPYGATTSFLGDTNRIRWTGTYQLTGSGNYLTGYRTYNPSTARFTQPDPTGQDPNVYAYTEGDPVDNSDTTGALSCPPGKKAITVAGGSQVCGGSEVFPHEAKCEYAFVSGAFFSFITGKPQAAPIAGIGACVGALNPFS